MTGFEADAGRLDAGAKDVHGHAERAGRIAADSLERAADRIGAAKVEMVRQLTEAAKNRDVAHSAAAAGHPAALLGLDTVLRASATNLSSLTGGLVQQVSEPAATAGGLADPVVNAHPGAFRPGTAWPAQRHRAARRTSIHSGPSAGGCRECRGPRRGTGGLRAAFPRTSTVYSRRIARCGRGD